MSTKILTGYTGERHITPYMDATVNRSIFGDDDYILATGGQLDSNMPDDNTFVISDGAFSIQGHIGITNGETLTVDNCPSGMNRIDLIVARFQHNSSTNIDSMSIVLLKGTETSSEYPTTPVYNTGSIAEGATAVDMPLYKIELGGSNIIITKMPITRHHMLDYLDEDTFEIKVSEGNPSFTAYREDTGTMVSLMVGESGTNHGVWSVTENKWLVNYDANGRLKLGGKYASLNSVLWSGAAYMNGAQSISLSQKVSDQANGIVLCWSAYSDGEAKNYDWVYQFIPRWHATAHSGNGVQTSMFTNGFEKVGSKYVYVSDTTIKGHANNTATGTRNSITYANNYWVLRAVIGV